MSTRILLSLLLGFFVGAVTAAETGDRRQVFRSALEKVDRGGALDTRERHALRDHALYGYLEYAQLRRRLNTLSAREFDAFFDAHGDLPVAESLRRDWLRELARRNDWAAFERAWVEQNDLTLRCHAAVAALRTRPITAKALDAAQALWLSGSSVPAACDSAFTQLAIAGRLNTTLRWQRIDLAAEQGNAALIRYVARGLDNRDRQRAESYAKFIETPSESIADWPADARSSRMLAQGLRRLARHDTDRAELLLQRLNGRLPLQPGDAGAVRAAIALWSAASFEASAARRLAAVPAASYDLQLHEWRVREALARRDWAAAAAAVKAMPDGQRSEPRWRYVSARLQQLQGATAEATALFTQLANEANYHGFLAADRINGPYAVCALEPSNDRELRRELAAVPGLQRALELHAIDRPGWALAEWNQVIKSLSDDERRLAVDMAVEAGWTDRAVFALNQGEDLRFYRLRFPLAHKSHLDREAKRSGLDPAWVAALIRAESAWQPSVRSHANAYGLMQLLPGTAAELAKRHGLSWKGTQSLFDARTNISLGTRYLAEMLARKAQQPYLATAAYNAGPTPVQRWIGLRPPIEHDLWIETIPYKETRDYVVRVMAFSVIYDWRLGRDAYPLSARLLAQPDSKVTRRAFQCPSESNQVASTP